MKYLAIGLLGLLVLLAGCVQNQSSTVTTDEQQNAVMEGDVVEIRMTAKQFEFSPNTIRVKKGQTVRIILTSADVMHGFALPDYNINVPVSKGEERVIEFVADKTGNFQFFCSIMCGAGHASMRGTLIVE